MDFTRFRRILVFTALLALIVVPMAGARTAGAPSVHPADDGWIGTALRWVEDLAGLRSPAGPHHGRFGHQTPPNTKTESAATSGPCIDPMGHPRPCY